jgi:hypothetical protein
MKNSAKTGAMCQTLGCQTFGALAWLAMAASADDHQHGNSNSQEPIGRSRRDSRR